jgi:membrane protease YdiL (CAAX protease family)
VIWLSSAVEEFGWQGFALPRLTQRLPPLAACLIHGVLWGLWHLPLYLTGAWSGDYQAVGLLFGITLTLAPTMFWLTKRAKGSVIPAILFHGAGNHYSALFTKELLEYPIFTEPLHDYFVEIKVCLYLAIALFLILMTRGRLGDQATSAMDMERQPGPPVEPAKA